MPREAFVVAQQFKCRVPLLKAGCNTRWVLVVGDKIEQFEAPYLAAGLKAFQRLFELNQVNTILQELNAPASQLMALGDPEIHEIGRILHQDDISGVAQGFGED